MNLEVKNLCAGYGGRRVLEDVNLSVGSGTVVTVLGPNGCGKSTLLKAAARLLKPESGEILLDGKDIRRFGARAFARKLAVLPQLHHAGGELTVGELVAFGRFPHRKSGFSFFQKHDREAVAEAISLTRLDSLRNRPLGTLSGGERQRAWIAMTLAQEPDVLLLDEPTTFLDVCCQFEIAELIRKLNRERGITIVTVLHDLNLASSCSDVLVMMKNGGILRTGTPEEILKPEILREVFEIESEILRASDGTLFCAATASARKSCAEMKK